MKVVILAGGTKSTINVDEESIPKPMVEIGGRPLLWHIMKYCSSMGYGDFIICGGYKNHVIKNYFRDYYIYQSDITVDLATNQIEIHRKVTEDWKVTVADTGLFSATGQRIAQIQKYVEEDMFLVTYGDCLSDIDVNKLVEFARNNDRIITMVVAHPVGRNETLPISGDDLLRKMKPEPDEEIAAWVNTGTYVFKKDVFKYLSGNYELDKQLLPALVEKEQVILYKHHGFWCPVETNRNKLDLEMRWSAGNAPWKVWDE